MATPSWHAAVLPCRTFRAEETEAIRNSWTGRSGGFCRPKLVELEFVFVVDRAEIGQAGVGSLPVIEFHHPANDFASALPLHVLEPANATSSLDRQVRR